jgi:hypothetical protein
MERLPTLTSGCLQRKCSADFLGEFRFETQNNLSAAKKVGLHQAGKAKDITGH